MFYIQKEEDIPVNLSVQTDNDQSFALIPETPHVVTSTFGRVVVHAPADFRHAIHGNNVAAIDGTIYLVSEEMNGDLTILPVGHH